MYRIEEKSYDQIVSENLCYYMRVKGFVTRTLGEKVGVSSMTISNWQRGKFVPKPDKLVPLCKALNISLEQLTTDMDKPAPNISVPAARSVPVIGTICAGNGVLAEENFDGYFFVDTSIRADFCLYIEGDSMIDANIYHGDIAFLRKSYNFIDGRIYAVVFGDNENAVLKKVFKQDDSLLLVPCNDAYKPIIVKDAFLCGELIGVYHSV